MVRPSWPMVLLRGSLLILLPQTQLVCFSLSVSSLFCFFWLTQARAVKKPEKTKEAGRGCAVGLSLHCKVNVHKEVNSRWHCQVNGSEPDSTSIYCGHNFFGIPYLVLFHI